MKRILLASLVILAAAATAGANVRLPAVIGSNMVLQRDQALPIWGWADPGEEVSVSIGDNSATAKAGPDGRWQVKLAPMKSSATPMEMTVKGKNTIKLANILVGEVWLCSGQSNMQWGMSATANAQKEIAAANFPKIRLFAVPLVPAGKPAADVVAQWKDCSPANVSGFSAVGYFFGRELHQSLDGVPIGLINSSWGGTRIEPWTPPVGFESQQDCQRERDAIKAAETNHRNGLKGVVANMRAWADTAEKALASGADVPALPQLPNHPLNSSGAPTGIYNGMIHPLVPFALRGAIWYQGESNNGQAMHYHSLMKALIAGWRSVWAQGDFPFLFVQIAPYRYGTADTALPELWEAQTATLAVPNTGMAVITDIATVGNIHPPNKQDVGKRLALWALAKTYGKGDVVYSGPLFDTLTVAGDKATLKFKHAEGGLAAKDGKPLTWFSVAGADKKFYPATAAIEGGSVVVHSEKVSSPAAVRFGWNQIAEPNLMNKAGLPASPFRTDKWSDASNAPSAP